MGRPSLPRFSSDRAWRATARPCTWPTPRTTRFGRSTSSPAGSRQWQGLALIGGHLYVADADVSAVRDIDLGARVVSTLVGEDLFVFGDQDGEGNTVRLQHPLGITARNGVLYLADSYNNNKIKRLDPRQRAVTTWPGSGAAGRSDGPPASAAFREPGGVCAGVGGLYIADTNNHRIALADWRSGEVRTVIGD